MWKKINAFVTVVLDCRIDLRITSSVDVLQSQNLLNIQYVRRKIFCYCQILLEFECNGWYRRNRIRAVQSDGFLKLDGNRPDLQWPNFVIYKFFACSLGRRIGKHQESRFVCLCLIEFGRLLGLLVWYVMAYTLEFHEVFNSPAPWGAEGDRIMYESGIFPSPVKPSNDFCGISSNFFPDRSLQTDRSVK